MSYDGLPDQWRRDPREREPPEDLAVYTWGEESYDGLGDVLQEGGDDLNDETFGSSGPIGKDFDFGNPVLPDAPQEHQFRQQGQLHGLPEPQQKRNERTEPVQPRASHQQQAQSTRSIPANSVEAIWQDHSPFSVLGRSNVASRNASSPLPSQTRYTPLQNTSAINRQSNTAVRTMAEVEAEMQAAAQLEREKARLKEERERYLLLQQRQQEEQLQQQAQERLLQEQQLVQQQIQQQQQQRQQLQRQQTLQLQMMQQQQQQEQLQAARMRDEEARQAQLMFEEERQQQQQLQQQAQIQRLLQQQREQLQVQQQRTPPPRMMSSSQSPRFFEHQRQMSRLQQQQEQEQQLLAQQRFELERQERMRLEELERRMTLASLERGRVESPLNPRRTPFAQDDPQSIQAQLLHHQAQVRERLELQQLQQQQQQQHQQQQLLLQQQHQQRLQQAQEIGQKFSRAGQRSQTPGGAGMSYNTGALPPDSQQSFQAIQLQQRLLGDLSQQGDFHREPPADPELLMKEASRKIVEAERMEERRRRKAAKIAHMARYNDLMTQSDKDFITRIQVSQLVTQDPYADDFYAQVYGAILRSRMGLQSQDERVLKFGSGGGIGLGIASKGGNRRPNAMQRMEQQVERIVSNARKREEEKGLHAVHSLQGALGKTSGRSYKAAPRQLLQVDVGAGPSPTLSHATATQHISKPKEHHHESGAHEAAKLGKEALGTAADNEHLVKTEPLSHRRVLVILEELYDAVLRVEQLRRDQPPPEDVEASEAWKMEYDATVENIWKELRVMEPLSTSDPHPFISLLTPTKGKKILPRLTRHLSSGYMLTLLTLLVACFGQLDVVKQAPILDSFQDTLEHADVDRQTQAFLGSVMQSILPVVSVATLRLVTGLLGLLLTRSDIVEVARSKPGLALLTLFLSRVEVIKQTADLADAPTSEESQQWRSIFDHLFRLLENHLLGLFPSSRLIPDPSQPHTPIDYIDQPVWQFLAALALHGTIEQHHVLVGTLREKILDNVLSVNKGLVHDEDERQTKLANVNLFLHAVNLDSSQIAM